jgi:hypothetical protein
MARSWSALPFTAGVDAVVVLESFQGFTPWDKHGAAYFKERNAAIMNPIVNRPNAYRGAFCKLLFAIELWLNVSAWAGVRRNDFWHAK